MILSHDSTTKNLLVTGQYEWVGRDDTQLYPECCGKRIKKNELII